ncbi:gliding motility-associated C-terminal domain-containing protein [Pedobacter paludis]|uniref:Gliding motility-associated C-terminal domain-containing protein n=1 Tax=Pedobacter paludis TaxID=2203212 RepID=A0A317EYG0_9SPHI|nr:gliding motility-associated C-terminal domain-containing protein [Pedobacter paludis]PWS31874.1 hypothetical protein DF947_08740 [Pedobacter paludis]
MEKRYYWFLFFPLLFSIGEAKAQNTTLPSTINTASNYGKINNQLYDFSIGEMVLVQTFNANSLVLTQGFLQPFLISSNPTDLVIVNNILTPNGDGKNDFFVVKGLEKYTNNKVSIFDRGGRLLFKTDNYQNNWDGYYNGKPLAEDTYYYIIYLEGAGVAKGFISILFKK